MACGQANHVDVVAHGGAVIGCVVVAPDAQVIPPANCHLGDIGHEVVGDALRVFTDQAAWWAPTRLR